MKKCDKKSRAGFSIRWKLIVYFAIFVAIALLVMWVFQVYLLNNFYELVKRREMARSAQTIVYHVEQQDLEMHAYNQALDGVMSVAVYRIEGEEVSQIVNVDAPSPFPHGLGGHIRVRYCSSGAPLPSQIGIV